MIRVEGLTKLYGEQVAVDDLSFEARRGEVLGVLGLNGAGKTTLLRMLAGDLAPSAGAVYFDGQRVGLSDRQVRARLGFLPEVVPLYSEMTPRSLLRFAAGLRGVPRREIGRHVERALERFDLSERAEQAVAALSHGYRKRLGLAQAAVHGPELLLLDEPISGLDPVQIVAVRELIRGLAGTCTVMLSSHILSEISQTCDRLLVIHRGRAVATGSEEELRAALDAPQRLVVELRADAAQAHALLGAIAGVEAVEASSGVAGRICCELRTSEDVRARVARRVVEAGVELLRLQPASGELEQVFVGLTEGRRGAAQAEQPERESEA